MSNITDDPFWHEGYVDYFDGVAKSECPYDEGTDGQEGWLNGWYIAQKYSDVNFKAEDYKDEG